MLKELRVRHFAIIDSLDIRFATGLNILTGETGAGKSILVGALLLVLGERADKTLVRTGASSCSAEAVQAPIFRRSACMISLSTDPMVSGWQVMLLLTAGILCAADISLLVK